MTEPFELGGWYIPIAVFIIVGMSNAVNLTDGLDGLAGLISATAFTAYGGIALLQGQSLLRVFALRLLALFSVSCGLMSIRLNSSWGMQVLSRWELHLVLLL